MTILLQPLHFRQKIFLFLCAILGFSTAANSQADNSVFTNILQQQSRLILPTDITMGRTPTNQLPGNAIPLKKFLKETFIDKQLLIENNNTVQRIATNCQDTSYSSLIGINNYVVYVESVTKSWDGGILVPLYNYDNTVSPNPSWKTFASLLKLDERGNVVWLKQFQDLTPGTFNLYYMARAFELPGHDIICIGYWAAGSNSGNQYNTDVYRLSPSGVVIWKNRFQSTINLNGQPGTYSFQVEDAIEAVNGDIILCGRTLSTVPYSMVATLVRLNNTGQLVWDANYNDGFEGVSVFFQNGQLLLVGQQQNSFGNIYTSASIFMRIDYNNGNLINKRIFRTSYTDPLVSFDRKFAPYYSKTTTLSNGNLLYYGRLSSGFANLSPGIYHFGVIEVDPSLNLLNAYAISSNLKTSYYNDELLFDATGRGYISLLQVQPGPDNFQYFGTFSNGQFQKLRKKQVVNTNLGTENGFSLLPGGGYCFIQSHFANSLLANSKIQFIRMHDSDTASLCLGRDTSFLQFSPFNIIEDPAYFFPNINNPNKLIVLLMPISLTDTTSTNNTLLCKQTNFCDTIKIHGNGDVCGYPLAITFTAFKNVECGAIVQWSVNNNAIDSMRILNDTTVTIWFRNINWQGKLYATISGGSCFSPAIDSLPLNITNVSTPVNLGPDTAICTGNSILLNAHTGYSSYLWQDNSTDSVFTVTQPGMYFVAVRDACGNMYRDTVVVSPHAPFNLSIGPDRLICKGDTAHLSATPGFLNYLWSPDYAINSLTSQQVIVSPGVDTSYYLKAEKDPGCFAYDTVRIRVSNAPPINLGPDESFCSGDSLVLNAGSGFTQYSWSNGSSTQQLTTFTTGTYSVIGITSDGCKSYDTLKVLSLYPLPVVNLGNDPVICVGTPRLLQAGTFPQYLWNTGQTTNSINVTNTGLYSVTVTDNNGCKGNGSLVISRLVNPPTAFLPADTAICNYGSMTLVPLRNFSSYWWNTNAATPQLTISAPGTYWLQVKDSYNCTGTDSIIVSSKECIKGLFVPSGFTPNNDGKNDVLAPLLFGNVVSYHFTIYNRWGQPVFQSVKVGEGWNGKVKGMPTDTHVFVWQCRYQLQGEAVQQAKGTVTLIR